MAFRVWARWMGSNVTVLLAGAAEVPLRVAASATGEGVGLVWRVVSFAGELARRGVFVCAGSAAHTMLLLTLLLLLLKLLLLLLNRCTEEDRSWGRERIVADGDRTRASLPTCSWLGQLRSILMFSVLFSAARRPMLPQHMSLCLLFTKTILAKPNNKNHQPSSRLLGFMRYLIARFSSHYNPVFTNQEICIRCLARCVLLLCTKVKDPFITGPGSTRFLASFLGSYHDQLSTWQIIIN